MAARKCSSMLFSHASAIRPQSRVLLRSATTVANIPGPPKCPNLGTFQDTLDRNGGTMDGLDTQMIRIGREYYNEFGNVVAHSNPSFGGDYFTAHDPRDFIQLYRSEGQYPAGAVQQVWPLKQYFELRGQQRIGEYFNQGPEWKDLRSKFAADLMQPKAARSYLPVINRVAEEACNSLEDYEGNMDGFVTLLAFDMFSAVCLGTVLQSANKSVAKPENLKFVADAQKAFSVAMELFFVPVEERTTHPAWFKFVVAMDDAQVRASQLMTETMEALESGTADELQRESYVSKLVARGDLSNEEIVQMMMFLLQAGVDTTASVTNWLLINLARNPQAQEKLRQEIMSVCPSGDVTEEHLKQMPYLKACVRESHRLTPALTLGTARPAPTTMVMSGFEIPEGALILTDNHCIQNDPALVDRVDAFLPERWSEDAVQARKGTDKAICDHAMLRDSFGMGARSCLGQRVAKLEIQVATARLVRDWNLELQPGQSWQTKTAPFAKAEPFPRFHLSAVA